MITDLCDDPADWGASACSIWGSDNPLNMPLPTPRLPILRKLRRERESQNGADLFPRIVSTAKSLVSCVCRVANGSADYQGSGWGGQVLFSVGWVKRQFSVVIGGNGSWYGIVHEWRAPERELVELL